MTLLINDDKGARFKRTMIWVTFQFAGMHCYPYAPEEVAYLRALHRHMFKFKVGIEVHHDDREIEFHMFMNWCKAQYEDNLTVDHKSCEMLANELMDKIHATYNCHIRHVSVEVSEDGECGAVVTTEPADERDLLTRFFQQSQQT